MKNFSIISAVSLNGVIGDSATNSIPWHVPTDLKHFKSKTVGKTVVMGSRTFHSIGKCLPNRRNVVITRKEEDAQILKQQYGVDEVYKSFTEVLKYEREGFVVIGGEHIYSEALRARPTQLFITIIHHNFDGDVRFPIIGSRFIADAVVMQNGDRYIVNKRSGKLNENGIDFSFVELELKHG